ncbi:Uncharacterised protein [Staphylococcus aureus]|nr:Uncharacterised protein [Staphylococcus aureus]
MTNTLTIDQLQELLQIQRSSTIELKPKIRKIRTKRM